MMIIDFILWLAVSACIAAILYCCWLHEKLRTESFKKELEVESAKFQNEIDSIVIRAEAQKLRRMRK
jgi:hypothetical protein